MARRGNGVTAAGVILDVGLGGLVDGSSCTSFCNGVTC
jgi:hypothetical protein